jgi:hypothetical protein
MSSAEVLTKAIQKAIEGGWHPAFFAVSALKWMVDSDGPNHEDLHILRWCDGHPMYRLSAAEVIFNHDFAKALWGEVACCLNCGETAVEKAKRKGWSDSCLGCSEPEIGTLWQHHLQQMVIADDPIRYLHTHLPQ